MKIIISPAKQMKADNDFMPAEKLPYFLEQANRLKNVLQRLTQPELKKLFGANDKITAENYRRYQEMDLTRNLTPAVLAYRGLAFSNMAPQVFSDRQWEYVRTHLKILSGFYGILDSMDGIVPYRLEMQAKLSVDGKKDLYDFWDRQIYEKLEQELCQDALTGREKVILNLASKEYSKTVEPFLDSDVRFVTCVFGELLSGKVKTKGTLAKMARGQMVAWLAAAGAETVEEVKGFQEDGYRYAEELSGENELVFLK